MADDPLYIKLAETLHQHMHPHWGWPCSGPHSCMNEIGFIWPEVLNHGIQSRLEGFQAGVGAEWIGRHVKELEEALRDMISLATDVDITKEDHQRIEAARKVLDG